MEIRQAEKAKTHLGETFEVAHNVRTSRVNGRNAGDTGRPEISGTGNNLEESVPISHLNYVPERREQT